MNSSFSSCLVLLVSSGWAGPAQPATGVPASAPVLTLEGAVDMALKGNRQLQAGALEITKAVEATAEVKTMRYPQLHSYILSGTPLSPINFTIPRGALGVYSGLGALPAADSTIKSSWRATALIIGSVSQPISQLHKIRLGIRESQLGEALARENFRQQRQEVAHQVKQTYYGLAQTQSQIASAEFALKYETELSALLERRLAQEAILKSDSLNAKASLSQRRYQLVTLRDALDTQKDALNRLLGRDLRMDFAAELQSVPSGEEIDLAAAQRKAIEQRVEIQKSRLQVTKAELDVRRQRAEYVPDLSVQVSYLSLANVNFAPQNITYAGFLLQWQPYDWGQKRHRLEELRATVRQATLNGQDIEEQIILDVNAKHRKLMEARALLDTQAALQELEREKLRVIMNRYEQEAALLPEVLQQQSALAQADSQFQRAEAGFWTAKADFDQALGEE